jgi:hypothetical protein
MTSKDIDSAIAWQTPREKNEMKGLQIAIVLDLCEIPALP